MTRRPRAGLIREFTMKDVTSFHKSEDLEQYYDKCHMENLCKARIGGEFL